MPLIRLVSVNGRSLKTSSVTPDSSLNIVGSVERKRSDLEWLAKNQILNGILENIPVIVFRIDQNGNFTEAMGSGMQRMGIRRSDVMGAKVLDLFPDVKDELLRALRGETVVCESHGVVNGEPWWLQNYVFFDFVQQSGAIGFALDITDRKLAEINKQKLEAQVQQSQKLESLGILAGGIAHDFNNLLMGILGNASLALSAGVCKGEVRGYVEQIQLASEKAAEICRTMLDYSAESSMNLQLVDLDHLIREIVCLLEVSISKNVRLSIDVAADLKPIFADAAQVRQVILNLVTNASDAISGCPGNIHLRLSSGFIDTPRLANALYGEKLPPDHYVILEVSDDGCGMTEVEKSKAFDPFFSTKLAGRGLGLATVAGILRRHQGAIECESEKGKGTTFRILFPAKEGHISEVEVRRHNNTIPFANGKVLVVDDDPIARIVIAKMLRNFGYRVVQAGDGLEGLDLFKEHQGKLDFVILDLTMPRLSGAETFKCMRDLDSTVRVLFSSAYKESEVEKHFVDSEKPDGFIQKPYKQQELLVSIAQLPRKATIH